MQITNHTELLNALIAKYNLKSYLEIGVQNPANNFDKVKCAVKYGVDPALKTNRQYIVGLYEYGFTSDEFFASMPDLHPIYDLIFIDGLHASEQVKKDFENSIRCLSDHGFIVIHDVLPENEAGTKVPRETKQWWGDVWKFAFEIVDYRLEYRTYNIDNGCMVIQKKPIGWNGDEFINLPTPLPDILTWEYFQQNKQRRLRITNEVII